MQSNPSTESDNSGSRHGSRFPTGRVIAGRYELIDRVGEGGTAEVYTARDHRLDRVVAVKVLRPQFGQDATARTRFATEARSAGALNVPNIVPVYDFGAADDGSLFIVMRYIDGPSLRQVITERGRLPAAAVADLGRQIAEALSAAHEHGLVHRDVKPGNILIDAQGTAHLTDFGTVKALVGAEELTKSGTIFGTAAYISPEQATGGPIGPATDLYALGTVLYETLSGRALFAGDDQVAVSYRHAHEAPEPLGALVPELDSEFEQLVMQSLEKAPENRPRDAAAVAGILDRVARRIAPRHAPRAALAEVVAGGGPALAALPIDPRPEQETVAIPVPVPPPTLRASTVAVGALAASSTTSWAPVRRGTWSGGPVASQRAADGREDGRRRAGLVGPALLLLALAVVVALGAVALSRLSGRPQQVPGVGVATATPPTATGTAEAVIPPVTLPPVVAAPVEPSAFPTVPTVPTMPTVPATAIPTPTPMPTPTTSPAPTARPTTTPVPTQSPTEPPTVEPTQQPTASPPAVISDFSVRVPDGRFQGDFHGDENGTYHGRTASWVYGQGTPYHTMTAAFSLDQSEFVGRAALEIVGLDGENELHNEVRIELNGVVLYEGPNPLPNDTCCNGTGPGNWGSAVFRVPRGVLATENVLTISNLEPTDCTSCSKFVMVDYFVVAYRALAN